MVASAPNGNPFRPGAGRMPPFLAGRDAELALVAERLEELAGGTSPAQGLLLYGPRGNGKTVLLERIAARARERGLRAEDLPTEAVRREKSLIETLQECAGRTASRLSGVQMGPLGATTQPALRTEYVDRLLMAWVEAGSGPLVAVLDEVQTMDPEVGRIFMEAVQAAWGDDLPFFLVAAGTPDAPRRVRRAGTFAERAFEEMPIGRLDAAATASALATPADAAGRALADSAIETLVGESQHYPYFIQLLGSAAWDAAASRGEPGISSRAAEDAVTAAEPKLERFYMGRFREARDRGIAAVLAPLAALVTERGGSVGYGELRELLRSVARDELTPHASSALLTILCDLGVLWETSPDVWEMGIPSFAGHVLQRRARSSSRPAWLSRPGAEKHPGM